MADDERMTLTEWVADLCRELALPAEEVEPLLRELLDLTREVAHGVERPAAPITLLLLGLGAHGDPTQLPALVDRVRALIPPPAAAS